MTLRGSAFLGLWNDCAPARSDYNSWHTREHVPERLSLPGFLSANRYVSSGNAAEFFTLYQLEHLTALTSETYGDLLSSPTIWSSSMRGNMRRFHRRAYAVSASLGAGVGGSIAVAHLARTGGGTTSDRLAAQIAALPAITAVHIGDVDQTIPEVPFAQSTNVEEVAADAVLIVEGFDETELRAALPLIDTMLDAAGSFSRLQDWSAYRLAYSMDKDDRDDMVPLSPPDAVSAAPLLSADGRRDSALEDAHAPGGGQS